MDVLVCSNNKKRIFCIFKFLSLTSLVSSCSPPGTLGNSFCTDTVPNLPGFFRPAYPENARILMDSYNFINLLPPHGGAVWQQVDIDGNNESWVQITSSDCRQNLYVCGFEGGRQENWLITQYICKVVNNTRLHQVSVIIEFEPLQCSNSICPGGFALYAFETFDGNATNVANFELVSRVNTLNQINDTTHVNQTFLVTFDDNEKGFYLAIRDETTCIAVNRVIVFYNVCPGGTEGLVMRPETLAELTPLEVTVECIEGASAENGIAAKLNCNKGGVWSPISGLGCHCNPGTFTSEDGRSCTLSSDTIIPVVASVLTIFLSGTVLVIAISITCAFKRKRSEDKPTVENGPQSGSEFALNDNNIPPRPDDVGLMPRVGGAESVAGGTERGAESVAGGAESVAESDVEPTTLPPGRLTQQDYNKIIEKLSPHSYKWRVIGERLGFTPAELSTIEATPSLFHGAPYSFLSTMLSNWMQWAPGDNRGSRDYAAMSSLRVAVDKAGLGLISQKL